MSARLSTLRIGALTLTPSFDPDVTEYAAATSNATNTVTAEPEDEDATVTLKLGGEATANPVTWALGENVLTVEVVNGEAEQTYTVTVTKS